MAEWEVVNFEQACKSGKRFRYVGPHAPEGHYKTVGHLWRKGRGPQVPLPDHYHQHIRAQCADCYACVGALADKPDAWILEKSEDELEKSAEEILKNLGLSVKETTRAEA